jgi:choline dehydrogenase-like flavoprotein
LEADASRRAPFGTFETDICIVGAGPAGLTIAHAFAGGRDQVLVLESGGRRFDRRAQALNDAEVVGAYGDLRQTRVRQVGGTCNAWNSDVAGEPAAKYVPLDPIDFEARGPLSGWPFSRDALAPWYAKAHALCDLGPDDYRSASYPGECASPIEFDDSLLTNGVYRFGTDAPFVRRIPDALARAANVTLLTHATAVQVVTDSASGCVRSVQVASRDGTRFEVRAKRFVLAGGAIENARLLLASAQKDGELGTASGWLGRCFMEHPRDYALRLVPANRDNAIDALRFYDQRRTRGGSTLLGRLALRADAIRAHDLPNASVTLLPVIDVAGADRAAHVSRWFRWTRATYRERFAAPELAVYPRGGAGWSAHPQGRLRFVRLLVNLEQSPNPENRVVLVNAADRHGMRRVALHWRWSAGEQARLLRLRSLLADALERTGLGRVEQAADATVDPRAHHHAGTTRMNDDPRFGVVDADCRVHGVENLFVAGASVFPTAGYANPMLTIVAMALRLAARLGASP